MTINKEITIKGFDGEQITFTDDCVKIEGNHKAKTFKPEEVTSISRQEDKHGRKYISIKYDGVILWGEFETVFYYSEGQDDNVLSLIQCINKAKYNLQLQELVVFEPVCLTGRKNSKLIADIKRVTIFNSSKSKEIPIEDIKEINISDDGKTIPHIEIVCKSAFLKGYVTNDFYYENKDDAEKVVTLIRSRLACI